jgi:ATP-dependent Clp protease ATP-binding subunit ClpA
MDGFPVPLDNLIGYVKALHPQDGPLAHLSDAVTVAARLDEQSDALIGHFVDQARHSGASWSMIGASMGVSKQAAQQRFVTALVPEGGEMFSRFTQRARNVLAAAGRIAAAAGAEQTDATHMAAGLLSEPEGIAARVIRQAGISDEHFYAVLGVPAGGAAAGGLAGASAGSGVPAGSGALADGGADAADIQALRFTSAGKAALKGTLKAALRLGHNYIGTEHLLLGILFADGDTAQTLVAAGLDAARVEAALLEELARIRAQRQA